MSTSAARSLGMLLALMLAGVGGPEESAASSKDRIGEKIQDVTLTDMQGGRVNLLEHHSGKVLVIAYTGVGCPISGRYVPRLEALREKFEPKGVRFVAINANPHNALDSIRSEWSQLGAKFPVLKDRDQQLTRQLDAKTTTVAFVIDKSGVIRYRGMVDDQYAVGVQRNKPKNKYLEKAIKAVLKGREPETNRTPAPGCIITRIQSENSGEEYTYSSHIASIVQENCQNCHRQRQIAPFPLTTYEEVRGWSAMIHSVLETDRMPPWNASDEFDGQFVNQRKLSPQDKKILTSWIENGMPRGTPDEDPPPKEWPKGWRIGKPDKIYTMKKSFAVPAEGVVEYQYFDVPTRFKKDRWIRAMEAKAGAEDVVHHILVFIVEEGQPTNERIGLDDGFLCATVPGDTPSIFPPGSAKRLPAGATLRFQVHYTTNGKKQRDRCRVGLIFADEPIEREVRTRGIYNRGFKIPANAGDHEVRADYTFTQDTEVLSFFPHMHTRGKSWRFVAHYPDGRSQTVLEVPRYDFNWQESYILNTPMTMPKGTRLECVAHFDNSEANFANPDPTVPVRWGEQTWEEMMIGYIDYIPSATSESDSAADAGAVTPAMLARGAQAYQAGFCAKCHRDTGRGGRRGPDLTDSDWLHCDGSIEGIEKVLRSGVPKRKLKDKTREFHMNPATDVITDDEQIRLLAVYVWSLSQN
ncbi:MAG: redoxin family protein [Planctomycetes bacterium]|nr:redoxin family protein [Planctomycetota bacterium]